LGKIKKIIMEKIKRIALVAHDNRKKDLIEWVEWNWDILRQHRLTCTGTTGKLVEQALQNKVNEKDKTKINIRKLKSGPLGGDQQLGAMIAEGQVDVMIFFWDPMQPQPHDVDVKALLRITVLYNVPTACNRSTADFIISSVLFKEPYQPKIKNYEEYIGRNLEE
jgi:methylglyoxal synthase